MIVMENIYFTYSGAKDQSLKDINLQIREGECVLITGQSGCGKTTLTRVMNGLCPKFYGGELKGKYLLEGKPIEETTLDSIGITLGSVFQDPRSQFFSKRVRDEIVLAMENHCTSREVMHNELWNVSELLEISHLHDRDMRNLSSGEKQKVAIASVCAMSPKGLVLDEPSANLDTNATAQLAEFLRKLKDGGHAIVISEHRLHYLRDVFDILFIMKDGKIKREYTREEALSFSSEQLEHMGLRLFDTPTFQVKKRVSDYKDMALRSERVSLHINDHQILKDVNIGATTGEVTAVTGSNGAGKTSLCRVLTGIQKESTGAIYLDDVALSRKKRVRNAFFVQQDVDYQLYKPSVEEEILMGTKFMKDDKFVSKTCETLGLDMLLSRHPNTLSGGQKQRVLIAAAILHNRPVIVLDEPTSGLDGHHMRAVSKILRSLAERGKTILLITHDLEFINLVADSIIYMHKAEVKYHNKI